MMRTVICSLSFTIFLIASWFFRQIWWTFVRTMMWKFTKQFIFKRPQLDHLELGQGLEHFSRLLLQSRRCGWRRNEARPKMPQKLTQGTVELTQISVNGFRIMFSKSFLTRSLHESTAWWQIVQNWNGVSRRQNRFAANVTASPIGKVSGQTLAPSSEKGVHYQSFITDWNGSRQILLIEEEAFLFDEI